MMRCKHTLRIFAWQLVSMPEYSATLPTATTPFKMWKNNSLGEFYKSKKPIWQVGQYYPIDNHLTGIRWFDVVLLQGPQPGGWSAPDWSNHERYEREGGLHAFPKHIGPRGEGRPT